MNLRTKKNCHAHRGVIVLDISEAKIPGVVRLDVSAAPFSHFHVRSTAEGSTLGTSDASGDFMPIATFADRAAADRALELIRAKLLCAHPVKTWGLRILTGLGALCVAIFLLSLLLGIMNSSQQNAPAPQVRVAPSSGVPVDADSKFGGG